MIGAGIGITTVAVPSAFSPLKLFSAGEEGAWYDPSDLSTMYQDSAATTPVTAVEQPVGYIADKSGNGNHATQATAASRPILREDASGNRYLDFDGVDDELFLSYARSVPQFSMAMALTRLGGGSTINLTESFALTAGSGRLTGFANDSNGTLSYRDFDSGNITGASVIFNAALTETAVFLGDFGPPTRIARENGVQISTQAGETYVREVTQVHIGGYAEFARFSEQHLYGAIFRETIFSAAEKPKVESYLAGKSGVTL